MSGEAVELAILLTAKDAATKVVEGLGAKFNALGAAGKIAAAGVAAVATAGVALIGGLTKLAQHSADAAGEVAKFRRETGLTAEESSKLVAIGERLGLNTDDLSKSFGILSKNLESAHPALAKYNIEVVKSKDGHIDMEATLGKVADRFKSMPDGVEKTAIALNIFGKSGKDMIPLLNQGSEGLKAMGEEAARLGLVFDDKALAAAKRYSMAQKDLDERVDGLKNRIGLAFIPVLADMAGLMVNIADKVLPPISAGFDRVTGFVKTAITVFGDMKAAVDFKQVGGGDALASLIGPANAAKFMKLVSDVSAEWKTLWIFHIRPAIEWAEEHIPKFWDAFKTAIAIAWAAAKPKLDELIKQADDLRDRFASLPPAVQHWAEATAAGVAVVKVTGLDDIIQGWANALGNFIGGGAGAVAALTALGVSIAAALVAFALLAVAIGVVIFVGTHLDDLEAAWIAVAGIIRLSFAQLADSVIYLFGIVLKGVEMAVNLAIDIVNPLWQKLGNPPIPHIHIDLPNADNVEKTLDQLARDRVVHLSVIEEITKHTASEHGDAGAQAIVQNGGPQALGGDYLVTRPTMFIAGDAGPERARFTPIRGGRSAADSGANVTINNYIGSVDSDARIQQLADAIDDVFRRRRYVAGGGV